jgi:hypothetical protein
MVRSGSRASRTLNWLLARMTLADYARTSHSTGRDKGLCISSKRIRSVLTRLGGSDEVPVS